MNNNRLYHRSYHKTIGHIIKTLAMLKCYTRTSLPAVKYSDIQAMFKCLVLIFLRMASLYNLFLCSEGE